MKRVMVFTLAYFPFVGGAEVALREVMARLKGRYDFHVVTARMKSLPSYEVMDGIPVRRIGLGIQWLDKLLFFPLAVFYGLFHRAARLAARKNLHRLHEVRPFQTLRAIRDGRTSRGNPGPAPRRAALTRALRMTSGICSGGVTTPAGFRAAGVSAGIKPGGNGADASSSHASGPLDLALLVSDVPATAAAVFTTNRAQAAPEIGRAHV